jgi:hypothetical protein
MTIVLAELYPEDRGVVRFVFGRRPSRVAPLSHALGYEEERSAEIDLRGVGAEQCLLAEVRLRLLAGTDPPRPHFTSGSLAHHHSRISLLRGG